jgi:F-type H+-transporting ATPase subunit b
MELLRLLSANEVLAQVISFLLLFAVLRLLFWKRLLGLLDQRREHIAAQLKKIEEAQTQVEGLKADYAARLAVIEEQARQHMLEVAAEGRKVTQEIRKKAYADAQDIIDNAKQQITYQLSKAKEEIKETIIDMTMKATEHVIMEKFTEDNDKRMIDDFLSRVDELDEK